MNPKSTKLLSLLSLTIALAVLSTPPSLGIEPDEFPKPVVPNRTTLLSKDEDRNSKSEKKEDPDIISLKGIKKFYFILDCSKSMDEKLTRDKSGNKLTKFERMKELLTKTLKALPADAEVAIRVYGNYGALDACKATSLIMPFHRLNTPQITKVIDRYKPAGLSPLTYALHEAIDKDLKENSEGKATIILITDGADTCGLDPASYMKSRDRKDLILLTVGFINYRSHPDRKKLEAASYYGYGRLFPYSNMDKYWLLLNQAKKESLKTTKELKARSKKLNKHKF